MKYIKYLRYLIIHKFWVFIYCCQYGLYWRGIIHDLSKFLPSEFKISKVHGQPKEMVNSKTGQSQVYYPVYHPAAALYHGSLRKILEKDFKRIPRVIKKIRNTRI